MCKRAAVYLVSINQFFLHINICIINDKYLSLIFYLQLFVIFFVRGTICEHQPPPGAPSFLRSSVESIPQISNQKNEALLSVSYGETALPLRSAVESVPSIRLVYW